MKKLHLVTQRGQPYGSQRQCCERCGLSIYEMDGLVDGYVTDERKYREPPGGWAKCADASKEVETNTEKEML